MILRLKHIHEPSWASPNVYWTKMILQAATGVFAEISHSILNNLPLSIDLDFPPMNFKDALSREERTSRNGLRHTVRSIKVLRNGMHSRWSDPNRG